MADSDGLAPGWYTSESGQRRYWTGDSWLVAEASLAPTASTATATASNEERHPRKRPSKKLLAIVVAAVVLLLLAGGVGFATKASADQRAAAAHAALLKKQREDAAEAKAAAEQAAADAKAAADQQERDNRQRIIKALEASVKKTAKKDVADGILDGPVLDSSCTPLGGGSTDDLTQKTATMDCFAGTKKNSDGTESGYAFSATVNWDTGEYSWRLGH